MGHDYRGGMLYMACIGGIGMVEILSEDVYQTGEDEIWKTFSSADAAASFLLAGLDK